MALLTWHFEAQPRSVSAAYRIARSLLFRLDPETAHNVSMAGLRLAERSRILPLVFPEPDHIAPIELMGLRFPNRIGLAAGLDKEGNTIDAMGRLGFGFLEIGTFTPRPQPGNPKPRLFRLVDREAIINRMGFNNPGIDEGVRHASSSRSFEGVVGFNIGKNKDTPNENAVDDYLACFRACYEAADYVAVNFSSPNTPGLRDLQSEDSCAHLLETLKREQEKLAAEHGKQVPLLFKVAPDLDPPHIAGLSRVFRDGGLDGLIATNTTISRTEIEGHPRAGEAGGLSGRPLLEKSNEILAAFHAELGAGIPIIGAGGVSSPDDAVSKIRAGASLVQIYSAFIFHGPALIRDCADRLDRA
ncbi:quinone-dependent dihydroorotate dehydrogenase [Haloferula sp. A504]|uniref:quinone-dependent dihydroorotate dehydrogenase n=1 Tax=Haloferula sp. A504 TaxID=3373601 RepID=UPI0031BE96A0|nr:quinone-dependent dihydroorotate dehydrogenase [Verrucomicrobiaceae bacterium E54]